MAKKFEILLSAKLDRNSAADIQKQINDISKKNPLTIKANTAQVDSLKASLKSLGKEASEAKSQTQKLSDIVGKFSSWQIVGDIIHGVKNGMKDMVDQVFELDNSLVELDKVTDLTSAGLEKLSNDAFDAGARIGATG